MTRLTLFIIVLSSFHLNSFAQQYLYFELRINGDGFCGYQSMPSPIYVELNDSIEIDEIIQNDSLLVETLNRSTKIYLNEDMVYLMRDVDSITQNNFDSLFMVKQKSYEFFKIEKWDNYTVKIAKANHPVLFKEIKFAQPVNTINFHYDITGIHFIENSSKNIKYVYLFE